MKVLLTEKNCYSQDFLDSIPYEWECKFLNINNEQEILNELLSTDYEVIFGKIGVYFSEDVLTNISGARVLVTPTTGHDHIDLKAIQKHKIKLLSLRDEVDFLENITSTAEHAWTMLLAGSRKLNILLERTKSASWKRDDLILSQLSNKNIGIIGYGRLGKIISDYAVAFRMNIVFCDPNVLSSDNEKIRKLELDDLLSFSDYIILSASYLPGDPAIITSKELNLAKKGVGLVNISRGELINENSIINALNEGILSFVGLDVLQGDSGWSSESKVNSKLIQLSAENDSVIITPHVGGYSREAITQTREFMLFKLIEHLKSNL